MERTTNQISENIEQKLFSMEESLSNIDMNMEKLADAFYCPVGVSITERIQSICDHQVEFLRFEKPWVKSTLSLIFNALLVLILLLGIILWRVW